MSRKKRVGEVVCRCPAYPFPHRMMGGDCAGGAFVRALWEAHMHDKCRDCLLWSEVETHNGMEWQCQALTGQEPYTACPELDEHVHYNEIKLYGKNRRER